MYFPLYLHRDVSHTNMLQPHFISCRGVSGAGGNMRGSRNFCQFYLVLCLFYSLKIGSNGFIAEKLYLYFTKDPDNLHYIPGGGGGGGPNANLYRNPYTYLLFSRGVSWPPIPLWIHTWAMSSKRDNIYHSPASNHNCRALICQD